MAGGRTARFDAATPHRFSPRRFSSVRAVAAGHWRNLLRKSSAHPHPDFVSHQPTGLSALLRDRILRGAHVEADAGTPSARGPESVHVDTNDGRAAPSRH